MFINMRRKKTNIVKDFFRWGGGDFSKTNNKFYEVKFIRKDNFKIRF